MSVRRKIVRIGENEFKLLKPLKYGDEWEKNGRRYTLHGLENYIVNEVWNTLFDLNDLDEADRKEMGFYMRRGLR